MASGHGGTTSGRAACHASDGAGCNSDSAQPSARQSVKLRKSTYEYRRSVRRRQPWRRTECAAKPHTTPVVATYATSASSMHSRHSAAKNGGVSASLQSSLFFGLASRAIWAILNGGCTIRARRIAPVLAAAPRCRRRGVVSSM